MIELFTAKVSYIVTFSFYLGVATKVVVLLYYNRETDTRNILLEYRSRWY